MILASSASLHLLLTTTRIILTLNYLVKNKQKIPCTSVIGGLRQYIWWPRSQPSHSNMCSASPFRRHRRHRAFNTDLLHVMLWSSVLRWTNTCEKLVHASKDSSHRSNTVLCCFTGSSLHKKSKEVLITKMTSLKLWVIRIQRDSNLWPCDTGATLLPFGLLTTTGRADRF